MHVEVEVEGRTILVRLDEKNWRWHSLEEPEEAAFPLLAIVDGKDYELYADGTFA